MKKVILVPYSPEWPNEFLRLKDVYTQHLSSDIKSVEHVGSTSVPGLDAKPILDIDIVIAQHVSFQGLLTRLSSLGYKHVGNRGITDREAFERADKFVPYANTSSIWPDHNLYVCKENSASLENHLLLRNSLRENAMLRTSYAALKHHLAEMHADNIDAYVEGKTDFITEILRSAGMDEQQLADIARANKVSPDSPVTDVQKQIEVGVPSNFKELTNLWEASVRATHHFLKEEDIQYFRPLVLNDYLKALDIYILRNGLNVAGFIGLSAQSIEMLFVHPDYRGKNIGRQLITFVVMHKGAKFVDVNEQNAQAVGFYQKMGFKITGRSDLDAQGKPYPLLHMELDSTF